MTMTQDDVEHPLRASVGFDMFEAFTPDVEQTALMPRIGDDPATEVIGTVKLPGTGTVWFWYPGQAAAGFYRAIVHTFDTWSRELVLPETRLDNGLVLPYAAVVIAACGAAATPLPEGADAPYGWVYCTDPRCWDQSTINRGAEPSEQAGR